MLTLLLSLAALVVVAWLLRLRPKWILAAATGTIAAIPIYWTPQLPGIPTTTATLVCLPVALVALFQRGIIKPNALDGIVILLVFWQVQTFATNFDAPRLTITDLLVGSLAPYLMMRVLAQDRELLKTFFSSVVISALALSLAALPERATGINFFQQIKNDGYAAKIWAIPYARGGLPRAATSFGQPLIFSLFLAMAAILVATGAIFWLHSWQRRVAALMLLTSGAQATGSRLAFGLVVLAILLFFVRKSSRALTVALMAAILAASAGGKFAIFIAGSDAKSQDSASYRGSLVAALTDSKNHSVGGILRGNPYAASDAIRNFNGSVDNEYLLRLLQSGTPELILFCLLGIFVLFKLRKINDGIYRSVGVVAGTALAGFGFVAILLQDGTFFWMMMGAFAAAPIADATARRQTIHGLSKRQIFSMSDR